MLSPCVVGKQLTRKSIVLPPTFAWIRPSCGTRLSAISISDIIFKRLITAPCNFFGGPFCSWQTPSIRYLTRKRSARGSKWISDASILNASTINVFTNLIIGASASTASSSSAIETSPIVLICTSPSVMS